MLKFVSNLAFCSTLGGLCFLLYSRYSSNFFWTATKEFPDWRLSNQGNVRRIHSKSWKWREIQITKKKIQLWIRIKLTKHWQFKWIFGHRIIILIHFCFKILQKLLYGSFAILTWPLTIQPLHILWMLWVFFFAFFLQNSINLHHLRAFRTPPWVFRCLGWLSRLYRCDLQPFQPEIIFINTYY